METNEIMKALRACAQRDCGACTCYQAGLNCDTKNSAAADLIEKQERQIQTLKWERDVAVEQAARDKLRWIPVKERLPEPGKMVLLIVNGKVKNITLIGAYELGEFDTDEGWILEMWPEWKDPKVTHWMPLPEPPEEEKDEK